jgi:hypothetical protein
MNINHKDYPEFKKSFWVWFDNLPKGKKMTFWYYADDMAETNFFFTVYSKQENNNA